MLTSYEPLCAYCDCAEFAEPCSSIRNISTSRECLTRVSCHCIFQPLPHLQLIWTLQYLDRWPSRQLLWKKGIKSAGASSVLLPRAKKNGSCAQQRRDRVADNPLCLQLCSERMHMESGRKSSGPRLAISLSSCFVSFLPPAFTCGREFKKLLPTWDT